MIRCIIVDDEPLAQRVIEKYVEKMPVLHLVAKCSSAQEAMVYVLSDQVDLVFLDINLPTISGLDFLRSLRKPPRVIIVTAYPEFALEGYDLDVVDYLVKPVPFERFFKAVGKVTERVIATDRHDAALSSSTPPPSTESCINVKADKRSYRLQCSSIIFIEALGDYLTLHTASGKLVVHSTMKSMEDQLPGDAFVRIHKSYIIAISRIEYVEGNAVKIGGNLLPIGKSYRAAVQTKLKE